jgi:3-oxoadipate enol-lactonase
MTGERFVPFVTVGDIDIYYERRGNGPRLLYISGTGGDLRHKPNVFSSPLPRSFDLIAYDQRGFGQTSKPDYPYTMADYANDAAGLLDAVGWSDAMVIGISFGGMVAQEFCLRHPNRLTKLVLCCTSSGGAGGSSFPLHSITDMSASERIEHLIPIADTRHNKEWKEANPEKYQAIVDLALSAEMAFANEPGHTIGALRQTEARRHHNTYERLPQLNLPVLICGGKYDGIAPPENQVALHRQLSGSKMELFEGGHMFLIQDRKAFPRIIEFLSE